MAAPPPAYDRVELDDAADDSKETRMRRARLDMASQVRYAFVFWAAVVYLLVLAFAGYLYYQYVIIWRGHCNRPVAGAVLGVAVLCTVFYHALFLLLFFVYRDILNDAPDGEVRRGGR